MTAGGPLEVGRSFSALRQDPPSRTARRVLEPATDRRGGLEPKHIEGQASGPVLSTERTDSATRSADGRRRALLVPACRSSPVPGGTAQAILAACASGCPRT